MTSSGPFQPAFPSDPLGKQRFFTSLWFCQQCQEGVCPVDLEISPVFALPAEQPGLPVCLLGLEGAEQWCAVPSRLPCL